ncbi:MAG: type I glyceraldehyde-3-phosphate dehydrogenase [Flavobacteriales bacterium]|nr:type I glyceraldehyde-3-phosphate dehydrogenase [Flavobacteriales bacterium]
MKRIAINGFGRIGRVTARLLLERTDVELVAVNDLTDTRTLAHLFKYDSVHGVFPGEVGHDEAHLILGGRKVKAFAEEDPSKLPWKDLKIDVVIECTGFFLTRELASGHLRAGAKRVLLSAPAKDADIKTVVLGVNDHLLDGTEEIISNASCTTNCAAPMIMAIKDLCGIEDGFITTVHSYTGDQRLHDAPHKDLRRARAAAVSMVPTTTGAAKAITRIFPELDGRLGGGGIRVPVPDGSITDITCRVTNLKTEEEINAYFKSLAEGKLKGILRYTEDPIVSVDIVGDPHSCIFDAQLTSVVGNMVKVMGWYDNEYGYSSRLVDLVGRLGA